MHDVFVIQLLSKVGGGGKRRSCVLTSVGVWEAQLVPDERGGLNPQPSMKRISVKQ